MRSAGVERVTVQPLAAKSRLKNAKIEAEDDFDRPSTPTSTRVPWAATDDDVILRWGGTGTAFLGKLEVSFPLATPFLGAAERVGFFTLDLGSALCVPGVAVGISRPAVSDAAGCGFQEGRLALAARSSATAGDEAFGPLPAALDRAGSVFAGSRASAFPLPSGKTLGSPTDEALPPLGEMERSPSAVGRPRSPESNDHAIPVSTSATATTAATKYFDFICSPGDLARNLRSGCARPSIWRGISCQKGGLHAPRHLHQTLPHLGTLVYHALHSFLVETHGNFP